MKIRKKLSRYQKLRFFQTSRRYYMFRIILRKLSSVRWIYYLYARLIIMAFLLLLSFKV